MTAFDRSLHAVMFEDDFYRLARFSRYLLDLSIQKNVDAFVLEQTAKSFRHIFVFAIDQVSVVFDHRHFAAKAAHGLREFQSDVTAAEHKKMFGDFVQFECFHVREWLCVNKTGNWR